MHLEGQTSVTVYFQKSFREKIRKIAKLIGKTTSEFIRDAASDKLMYEENRLRIEKEKAKLDAEAERTPKRKARTLRKLGGSMLAPAYNSLEPEPLERSTPVDHTLDEDSGLDPVTEMVAHHGPLIAEVLGKNSIEERLRVAEAIAAVKRAAPLTHPSDKEILVLLEREVIRVRGSSTIPKTPAPTTSTEERVVNPHQLKTQGDL